MQLTCQLRRVVLGDEEEDAHGVKVGVGRLSLRQLDCCDAERPDVGLPTVSERS